MSAASRSVTAQKNRRASIQYRAKPAAAQRLGSKFMWDIAQNHQLK
jgi:hypothetical protein